MQAANTGLTGSSTPDGSDYDRDVVIVSTLRIAKIRLIGDGRQVICLPGATLYQLEAALKPLGREPHSVIGSSCSQMTLFARIHETGEVGLVNHLGVKLGNDPQTILDRLDRDAFTEADIDYSYNRATSDHHCTHDVRNIEADTPGCFNADPKRSFEAAGSSSKVMIFAVRLDTFARQRRRRSEGELP